MGEGLFARVNRATERVLRANNFNVNAPKDQVCCGALHAHAGDLEGARELARKNIEAFKSNAPIVTNAGGCGAMLATYGHLFANDETLAQPAAEFSARVRDVSQQLRSEMRPAPSAVESPVTYDTSCHLLYGQRTGEASERMLRTVAGDNFVPLNGTERCCGAAGIYNLLQPDMSQRVLNEKLAPHQRDECCYTCYRQPRLPDAHRRRRPSRRNEAASLSSNRVGGPGVRTRRILQRSRRWKTKLLTGSHSRFSLRS